MPYQLIKEVVNIEQCPAGCSEASALELTLGDLHANALKLLYTLVRHGVLVVNDKQYAELVSIYKTPILSLTADLIKTYDDIIDSLPVANRKLLIRLIGDETCDRGMNDYFVLKLIEKLRNEEVPFRLLASNHGIMFLKKYNAYKETKTFPLPELGLGAFEYSSIGLRYLLEQNILSEDRLTQLVEEQYNPTLKLLDYNISPDGKTITVFSHACIDTLVINYVAQQLQVAFNDSSALKLAATIDAINHAFETHVRNGTVPSLRKDSSVGSGGIQAPICTENAIDYILWNRKHDFLNRAAKRRNKNYTVHYVHGHDMKQSHLENVVSLDNLLGKSPHTHSGIYNVLVRTVAFFDLEKLMQRIGDWIKKGLGLNDFCPVLDNYSPEDREKIHQSLNVQQYAADTEEDSFNQEAIEKDNNNTGEEPESAPGSLNAAGMASSTSASSSTDYLNCSYEDELYDDEVTESSCSEPLHRVEEEHTSSAVGRLSTSLDFFGRAIALTGKPVPTLYNGFSYEDELYDLDEDGVIDERAIPSAAPAIRETLHTSNPLSPGFWQPIPSNSVSDDQQWDYECDELTTEMHACLDDVLKML